MLYTHLLKIAERIIASFELFADTRESWMCKTPLRKAGVGVE